MRLPLSVARTLTNPLPGLVRQPSGVQATLGAELLTNPTLASNATGWTLTNATWSAGAVVFSANGSMSQSVSVVSGQKYRVTWTQTPWPGNGNPLTVALGAASQVVSDGGNMSAVLTAATTGTVTFSLTGGPTSTGSYSGLSLKAVTATATAAATITDGTGATVYSETRIGQGGSMAVGVGALANWVPGSGGSGVGNITAFGYQALSSLVTGAGLTAVGHQALKSATNAEFSTAVGQGALQNLTSGYDSTAVGQGALQSVTSAWANTAVGTLSLNANTANFCTAVGNNSLNKNTTGVGNTAMGNGSAYSNTTGTGIVAMGNNALNGNVTGNNSTALGYEALRVATADANTAVGYHACYSLQGGTNNVAVGRNALLNGLNQQSAVVVGDSALSAVTTGNASGVVAIGASALVLYTGATDASVAIGQAALNKVTSGGGNVAIGTLAGTTATVANAATTASNNVYIGFQSGPANTFNPNNTVAVGYQALVAANATAIGSGVNAGGAGSVVIGRDNAGTAASTTTVNAFVLGTALHQVQVLNNATGAGSAALGANSPATTNTAPYTWLKMLSGDGSTVYVPCWK